MNLNSLIIYLCRNPRTDAFIRSLEDVTTPQQLRSWFSYWSRQSDHFNTLLDATEVRELIGQDF